jgi:cytochrome c oxidase assembly protein subunit 15
MIIIQIILGGITRLTGSGLSITEWDVVTGTMPPVTQQQWTEAFAKYKTTEQFKQLNADFTLPDFKFIFFWEWFHRFWGRLIGVVFAIPFIIFIIQKRFRKEHILPLVVLFILGGLQGAVGWIMVASGLTGDAVYVRPTKLAMHFVLALILLFYTYWFYLKFKVRRESLVRNKALHTFTWVIIVLFYVQLFYGALMAGHKAAVVASTWPDMNGSFIPASVFNRPEGLIAVIENPIVVHFIHRMTAYLLVFLVIVWSVQAFRIKPTEAFSKTRWLPLFFVLLQTTLGVLTVVTSVHIRAYIWNEFEWMAQLHQLVALFLLLSLAHAAFLLSTQQKANLS